MVATKMLKQWPPHFCLRHWRLSHIFLNLHRIGTWQSLIECWRVYSMQMENSHSSSLGVKNGCEENISLLKFQPYEPCNCSIHIFNIARDSQIPFSNEMWSVCLHWQLVHVQVHIWVSIAIHCQLKNKNAQYSSVFSILRIFLPKLNLHHEIVFWFWTWSAMWSLPNLVSPTLLVFETI